MKSKSFILIFLVTLVFSIFSQSDLSRFLLGFEFLLEIVLFAYTRILNRCIDKSVSPPVSDLTRGQELCVEIQLRNRCIFPVSELEIELICRDDYSGSLERFHATAMLDGHDSTSLRFVLRPSHCGIVSIWATRISVCDMLGINCAVSHFPKQQWQIAVLPPLPDDPQIPPAPDPAGHTADTGSGPGGKETDPSPAYELRVYREGEPLRNVHWKLSAKTDQLLVKEFENPQDTLTLVFLDLDCPQPSVSRQAWDHFLDTVAAFSASLLHAAHPFGICWLDDSLHLTLMQIRNPKDMKTALTALLQQKPHPGAASKTAYKENLIHEAYNATVRIDLSGKIIREEAGL